MIPLPALMGQETEYAVVGRPEQPATSGGAGYVADCLLAAAEARLVAVRERSGAGLFLGNGARFYLDAGGHPEFATPECSDPWEVIRYVRAGERILAEVAVAAAQDTPGLDSIDVFRCNVDYASPRTGWGCHESYLHRSDLGSLPPLIIPHLASRIIYTGAGGFHPYSAGLRFTLSPRAWLTEYAISDGSTERRGIYHTRNEPLGSNGYHRLHVICGESLCTDLGILLKVGVTSLIVAAIDAGCFAESDVELESPVSAMHSIAADPSCTRRVRLSGGRRVTAIELQRHYLDRVEVALGHGALPDWAPEICARWRETLDALEHDPVTGGAPFDWGIKLALLKRWVRTNPSWRGVERWIRLGGGFPEGWPREPGSFASLDGEQGLTLRRLRQEAFEIDVRFGQLGERGIFTQLDRAGCLAPRLVPAHEVDHAVAEPPHRGRARTRGKWIQEMYQGGRARTSCCTWTALWNAAQGKETDLADPFGAGIERVLPDQNLAVHGVPAQPQVSPEWTSFQRSLLDFF